MKKGLVAVPKIELNKDINTLDFNPDIAEKACGIQDHFCGGVKNMGISGRQRR